MDELTTILMNPDPIIDECSPQLVTRGENIPLDQLAYAIVDEAHSFFDAMDPRESAAAIEAGDLDVPIIDGDLAMFGGTRELFATWLHSAGYERAARDLRAWKRPVGVVPCVVALDVERDRIGLIGIHVVRTVGGVT
jgi:hypothetical protein